MFFEVRDMANLFLCDTQFGPALHVGLLSVVDHTPRIFLDESSEGTYCCVNHSIPDIPFLSVRSLLAYFFFKQQTGQDLNEIEVFLALNTT